MTQRRQNRKTRETAPKLSVFTDVVMLKRIQHEKVESGLTMEEIVNARLDQSYRDHPGLIGQKAMASSA